VSTSTQARSPSATPRRVVFLPYWHDNPYQELLAANLTPLGLRVDHVTRRLDLLPAILRGGRPAIVHLHAPDHFVAYRGSAIAAAAALVLFLTQIALLRMLGVRIVWTVHDLVNHEGRYPRIDRLCRTAMARLAHVVIMHCEEACRRVSDAYGVRPDRVHVIPHGHYQDRYPPFDGDATAARITLDLPQDAPILLFFGNLRRYKGLHALLEAYDRLDRAGTRLVIAGQPFDAETAAELEARLAGRDDVLFRPGFVPEDRVTTYLRAADVVVCPFTSSLTSGSLALALSFGKACVAPRLGCAGEMMTEAGGFLYDPDDADGLVTALRAAIDARPRLDAMGQANARRMQALDWPAIARRTAAAYDGTPAGGTSAGGMSAGSDHARSDDRAG
jgi:glycosyltransferase involved in cell wall biosynthesis